MKRKQMLFCIMLGILLTVFAFGLSASSVSAQAGGLVPCNGPDCQACQIVDLIQNIINYAIGLSIPIAMALFAYAGVLYFTADANLHGIDTAKKIFRSAIIGFIVALGAYLIVDTILHSILDSSQYPQDSWFQIQCTGAGVTNGTIGQLLSSVLGNSQPTLNVTASVPACAAGSAWDPNAGACFSAATQSYTNPVSYNVYGGTNAQCASDNAACSVSALESVGYTPAEANVMSCIAVTESSGNPNTPNSSTGACGTFQVLQSNWAKPSLHSGSCSTVSSCNDPDCNAQAAYQLSQGRVADGQSPYADWTCPGCNAKADSCVQTYDPGN